jgi:hypothetical protein
MTIKENVSRSIEEGDLYHGDVHDPQNVSVIRIPFESVISLVTNTTILSPVLYHSRPQPFLDKEFFTVQKVDYMAKLSYCSEWFLSSISAFGLLRTRKFLHDQG